MIQEFNTLCASSHMWLMQGLAGRQQGTIHDYESLEHQIHPETKWAGQAQSSKTMSKTISCKVCVDCSLGQKRCHNDKRDPQERADITNLWRQHMLLLHWPYWTLNTTAKLVAWLTMTIHTVQQNNYPDLNYIFNNYLILTVCLSCDAAPTFTHTAK